MGRIEEGELGSDTALPTKRAPELAPAAGFPARKRAEIGDYTMARALGRPYRLDKDPVGVILAAFLRSQHFKNIAIDPPLEGHDRIKIRKTNM